MGLINRYLQKKMQQYLKEDPEAKKIYNDIVGCGPYNGSNMKQANECYETIKDKILDRNPHTRKLFEENLNSGQPMSLVACYAFAVGEFIEDPNYIPYGLNTKGASNNLRAIKVIFPDYVDFVHRKHSGTEESTILLVTGNLTSYFTDVPLM